MAFEICNPDTLREPSGLYSVLARVRPGSEFIFISGMTFDDGEPDDTPGLDDFERQCSSVYRHIGAALASAGASYTNVIQFTTYLVDPADVPRFAAFRKRAFPKMFPNKVWPVATLLVVSALASPDYRIEVHTVAAL